MSEKVICVDIGSTYTKGAIFEFKGDCFELLKRAVVPTTVEFLPNGFYSVLDQLNTENETKVFFSSSAKGGLKVAVIGLVPEMSLNIAKLAACSAGAKVCASYPYKLTKRHVAEIEQAKPDILLFCGGTDGGNEKYAIENSEILAKSNFNGTILFAGNSYAVDAVADNLAGKELIITENVMPDFGKLNIEPVREAIRKIFLEKIITGKGLDELVSKYGNLPVPTPLAVFNLVNAIGSNLPDWKDFALIDMGGATTDFYSYTKAFYPESDWVIKGIIEPTLKRTVEGDLGMRVSGESAFEASEEFINYVAVNKIDILKMKEYAFNLPKHPDYLPENEEEQLYDKLLAEGCIYHSMLRHAGTVEEVFTCNGRVWAQTGKDLQRVSKIVGTGGYLAAMGRNGVGIEIPTEPCKPTEKRPLLPKQFEYYSDNDYILPLLGSLAEKYPKESAITAITALKKGE